MNSIRLSRSLIEPLAPNVLLGDQAHTMLYLERQFDDHDFALAAGLSEPVLDQARESPQFRDLVRRMGLPPVTGLNQSEALELSLPLRM